MNAIKLPSRSVVYVMDAYCGWCWGFAERMGEFEAANRHRVAFTAISGGLFTGARARPIAAYAHIAEANARIARLTGADFGPAYQRLLAEGTMVMDSSDAAAALAALRELDPRRAIHWAHRLQEAFYAQGRSLSEPAHVAEIATANGLDAGEVLRRLRDGSARAQAEADFALARRLGVSTYPTLLFVDGPRVHALPATGTPLDVLNGQLDTLLA
ncbi:DsbA family protein [Azohydromonas australica]|uniref:DsbA family protein n=1 Tax=Azohydromonas australica TaxID=364039 RepID=UPI000410E212|nr:DsbA family protein [Azohydromonas australica]